MQTHVFTIVVEQDPDGFFAYCPQLQGCYTQGETYDEAFENIKDALTLHVEDRKADSEDWRSPSAIHVTSLALPA